MIMKRSTEVTTFCVFIFCWTFFTCREKNSDNHKDKESTYLHFIVIHICLYLKKWNFADVLRIYRVFIIYCVFSKILRNIPDSGLYWIPLSSNSECTQWQAKHQRYSSRTCRVQKNHNMLRKNTVFNWHPV